MASLGHILLMYKTFDRSIWAQGAGVDGPRKKSKGKSGRHSNVLIGVYVTCI